jgi:hypothetical protein
MTPPVPVFSAAAAVRHPANPQKNVKTSLPRRTSPMAARAFQILRDWQDDGGKGAGPMLTDEQFRAVWWPRLRASCSQSQSAQNRVHRRYVAACHAREAIQVQARQEAEAASKRAAHAAAMRRFRARQER